MKKIIIILLLFLSSICAVNAITIENVSITSGTSNTTINFTKAINTTNVTIGDDYINLQNFKFENNENFTNSSNQIQSSFNNFNWTEANSEIFTGNFIHYFRFNLTSTGTLLSNWTFGSFSTTTDELSLFFTALGSQGNKSFEFSKFGYVTGFYDFIFNYNSVNNVTFNVTPATINVNIYDVETGSLITDLVELQLIATQGANTTTTTGQASFDSINFQSEEYQIIASSANYETESIFFTYSNQENITQDIYMLKSNSSNLGNINIQVKDQLSVFIESAIVKALKWDATLSSYVTVAQCQTNANGVCTLNIELNDALYKFQAEKDAIVKTTNSQIITTSGTTLTIILEDVTLQESSALENLLFNFTETVNNNVSLTRLEWVDTGGIMGKACISVYRENGFSQTLLSQNCTTSSSGILFSSNNINNTYAISIKGSIEYDGVTYPLGSFFHQPVGHISEILEDYNLDMYIPIIFLLISIGIGLFFGNIYIALSLAVILEWMAVLLAPNVMTTSIAVVITILSALIFWGVSKK